MLLEEGYEQEGSERGEEEEEGGWVESPPN